MKEDSGCLKLSGLTRSRQIYYSKAKGLRWLHSFTMITKVSGRLTSYRWLNYSSKSWIAKTHSTFLDRTGESLIETQNRTTTLITLLILKTLTILKIYKFLKTSQAKGQTKCNSKNSMKSQSRWDLTFCTFYVNKNLTQSLLNSSLNYKIFSNKKRWLMKRNSRNKMWSQRFQMKLNKCSILFTLVYWSRCVKLAQAFKNK